MGANKVMDNNVVKRNLEDLENQVVVMIRIDGQIMALGTYSKTY